MGSSVQELIQLTSHSYTSTFAAMEAIRKLEAMVSRSELKLEALETSPSTRTQARLLLDVSKELHADVAAFPLPDLEAEYSDEEGERLDDALDRYNELRQTLADTEKKASKLLEGWAKLDKEVTSLTEALTKGASSSVTMEKIEESMKTLKSMFLEREGTPSKDVPAAASEF